jgi:hypothetical protein
LWRGPRPKLGCGAKGRTKEVMNLSSTILEMPVEQQARNVSTNDVIIITNKVTNSMEQSPS